MPSTVLSLRRLVSARIERTRPTGKTAQRYRQTGRLSTIDRRSGVRPSPLVAGPAWVTDAGRTPPAPRRPRAVLFRALYGRQTAPWYVALPEVPTKLPLMRRDPVAPARS